ncbi:cellulose binding domain-containing protein [Microbispora sp. NPDC049125]|uniref:cellulose binding domain-containing protein n=1 Tax=Microbispora sp. NPDC049125 TaxID=3154929 RepID=UPI0034676966
MTSHGVLTLGEDWPEPPCRRPAGTGATPIPSAGHNGWIPPGGSTSFGFRADHTGSAAKPAAFTLNGAACTVSLAKSTATRQLLNKTH